MPHDSCLPWVRYGGGSFNYVDAEIEEEALRPHLATVTLALEKVLPQGVVISATLIQAELAAYIGGFCGSDFAWEVTETDPLVFSVPFPFVELFRVCSHNFIRCPINQFLISIHAAAAEPDLVPPLDKVWVLVYSLPRAGTADLASFEDDGPARIEILCPTPAKIDGMSLIFYFGARGRRLTFELESPVPEDRLQPAPAAFVPRDEGQEGDGSSSGESSFCEEDDGDVGISPTPSDGRCNPVSTGGGSSSQDGQPSQVASGVVVVVRAGPPLVATTAVDLEIVEADVLSVGMEVCPTSSPRSPGVVCYSSSPGSPSSPALGSLEREPPPPLDLGLPAVTHTAASPKARDGASPLVSACQSARLSQSRLLLDGRVPTIQEKATLRAVARDLSPVATDSGIVFHHEKGHILKKISTICAKEKLEGALEEARACAARDVPSSSEPSDPGHRETSGGASTSMATVAGTSVLVPSR
ncbi:hypothetical protein ZWY2020_056413 [Hordeum vulgare]|nr:hypothetical protein ZWY2020_056413 [Hordeum vulgare]